MKWSEVWLKEEFTVLLFTLVSKAVAQPRVSTTGVFLKNFKDSCFEEHWQQHPLYFYSVDNDFTLESNRKLGYFREASL